MVLWGILLRTPLYTFYLRYIDDAVLTLFARFLIRSKTDLSPFYSSVGEKSALPLLSTFSGGTVK